MSKFFISVSKFYSVFWIRIHLIRIRIQVFFQSGSGSGSGSRQEREGGRGGGGRGGVGGNRATGTGFLPASEYPLTELASEYLKELQLINQVGIPVKGKEILP